MYSLLFFETYLRGVAILMIRNGLDTESYIRFLVVGVVGRIVRIFSIFSWQLSIFILIIHSAHNQQQNHFHRHASLNSISHASLKNNNQWALKQTGAFSNHSIEQLRNRQWAKLKNNQYLQKNPQTRNCTQNTRRSWFHIWSNYRYWFMYFNQILIISSHLF